MIVLIERLRVILRAEDPESWRRLGLAYSRCGQWSKAVAAFDYALGLAPHDGNILEAKGNACLAWGSLDLAVACYKDAARLDLFHRNPQRWNNLGVALARLGRREDAITAYRKALEHDPKNSMAWNNIITEFYEADRPIDIAATCEDAIRHVPEDPHIWFDYGCALEKLSNLERAEWAYAEAWRLRPNFPGPWTQLIRVRAKLKRFEDAASVCSEVAQFNRNHHAHALYLLCDSYIWDGHYQGAEEVLATLSKVSPDQAERLRSLLASRIAETTI